MQITVEYIQKLYSKKGFLLTDFNIFGVRLNDNLDKFTDIRGILRKVNGSWEIHQWNQTTKPALHAMTHPVNVKGTAIIKEGQYINAWEFGLHFGHPALVQCKNILVYRDNTKSGKFDISHCQEMTADPSCGLNHHTIWWVGHPEWDGVYPTVSYGGDWSEGCQCGERPSEHNKFMELCHESNLLFFTYSLFNATDFQ